MMTNFQISKFPNFKALLILLIIVLAAFLRLYKLDQFPAGLNADEAAIGYNAYSLLETGRDEHGNAWPVHFKSFGDYKPGLYFYLTLPFVKVLGLNIWAVRLPSAILGTLGVLGIFLLVRELFKNSAISYELSAISSFLLAISPWHLHFSRGGWETNAAAFFILVGVFGVLRGLRSPKFFVFGFLFLVFSLYTYHSARIVVPLLLAGLFVLYKDMLFKQIKWVVLGGSLTLVLLLPLMRDIFSPAGISRFSGVGFLAETGPLWRINELRGEHQSWNAPAVRLFHNKLMAYSLSFLENYFDHFHGEFLFLSGDEIERNRVPETGQMYLFDILLLPLGIYFLLKNRPPGWKVIFLWLGVSPVAAALTFQTPHAIRALNMVISLVVISAYGLVSVLAWIKKKHYLISTLLYGCIAILLSWNAARYLHQYYVHYPKTYPAAWEYGFKELVGYVKSAEDNYQRIYVTDKYDQPYILFLFYLKYSPQKFQKEVILSPRDKFGFSTVRDFDKYHFQEIRWEEVKDQESSLIVGTGQEIPESANIIKQIYFPGGKIAFKIAKV